MRGRLLWGDQFFRDSYLQPTQVTVIGTVFVNNVHNAYGTFPFRCSGRIPYFLQNFKWEKFLNRVLTATLQYSFVTTVM